MKNKHKHLQDLWTRTFSRVSMFTEGLQGLPVLTQYVQIRPGADGGDAAAAEDGLALVVAGIAHHGTEDGQPAVEVTQTAGHQHAVLTPRDAQLDERPAE